MGVRVFTIPSPTCASLLGQRCFPSFLQGSLGSHTKH